MYLSDWVCISLLNRAAAGNVVDEPKQKSCWLKKPKQFAERCYNEKPTGRTSHPSSTVHREMVAFRAVETDVFGALVKTLHLRFLIPSCKYFIQSKNLKLHSSCHEKVEQTAHTHSQIHTRHQLCSVISSEVPPCMKLPSQPL